MTPSKKLQNFREQSLKYTWDSLTNLKSSQDLPPEPNYGTLSGSLHSCLVQGPYQKILELLASPALSRHLLYSPWTSIAAIHGLKLSLHF